ncbi:MAG: methionyl-tRNA formyltransferase [Lutimonas sp.]
MKEHKNESLRIVFMGTPDFAVASLKALVETGHDIVGVITAPDKPAGRGRKIRISSVKQYALQQELRLLQPTNLKDPSFLDELASIEADLQIVVAFRMLPQAVWQMPRLGTFNLHASLLPQYRGAAPINWAIIKGETRTGVTTFFINEEIDTGAIIRQKEVDILENETAGDLHDKLMVLGSRLVVETAGLIAQGSITPLEQSSASFTPAPKLNKENCRIDWAQPLESVYNQIRGLSPYPGAWTLLSTDSGTLECKILESGKLLEKHDLEPGSIEASKKEIRVAVENGYIKVERLQLSGKRKMDAVSFLNGFSFSKNDRFK